MTGVKHLTTDSYEPDEIEVMKDSEGKPTGIALTRYSDEVCEHSLEEDTLYTFSVVVTCDPNNTAVGGGKIDNVNTTDKCSPVAYVSHAAGCPVYTANEFVRVVQKYPWLPAIIQIGIGFYIAFNGHGKFNIAAPLFAFFTVVKILLFESARHGYMDDG